MARVRTLSQLTELVRQQTDQQNSTFITDAEITNWLNQGIADCWRAMTRADPDWYLLTTQLSTTAGTLSYNMYSTAAAFALLRGVDLVDGDRRHTLRPYTFAERNKRRSSPWSNFGDRPRYRMTGNALDGATPTLNFDRDPGTNTYDIHYVPGPTRLLISGDEYDGVMGFEDWPVHWAASMIHDKAEEETAAARCRGRIAEMKAEVAADASRRHRDGGQRISKTRRRVPTYDECEGW